MDEQIIRTLQEQAIEERQYIQEKYGQDEDVVQVVNRRDYLTGRQSAAVRLYDNERNVPLHRHGYIELMYAYKGTFTHRFGEEKVLLEEGDLLVMNQYVSTVWWSPVKRILESISLRYRNFLKSHFRC